jgi:hypothetical protein
MNVKHMKMMADLLREIAADKKLKKHFNLRSWVGRPGVLMGRTELVKKPKDMKVLVSECGTTACACGYAGLTLAFIKKGFQYNSINHDITYTTEDNIFFAWEAVKKFFDLSSDMAEWLFLYDTYFDAFKNEHDPKPSDVLRRVEFLIEEYTAR